MAAILVKRSNESNVSYLQEKCLYCFNYLLGTPDTNLNGLRTLNALSAFTSKLPELINAFTKIVANLKKKILRKCIFNQVHVFIE